ncbi:unnamed protein product [Nesidiocoris tenuis]|uniref:DOP1 N-terminal domain-containing protein n=1 Tax=Nesidiocoris tenuis TaxID=355587 RepID=A0A6H5GLY2_9HEMI|nr:unnamed protein product [Nesidiocoris tenuis]
MKWDQSLGKSKNSFRTTASTDWLFPLFGYCAMKVRPELLAIYEKHFVPLGPRLRPALPGFLSGVLPGFEESSDYFAKTNQLLEIVCEGVGRTHFYGCIWDCIASNSNVRLPASSFVLAHFDKKKSTEDQPHLMGNDIETMICTLTEFLLDKVSTFDTSTDTPSKHLPSLFLQVVTLLAENCNQLTSVQIVKGLKLCSKILNRVQPVIVGHHNVAAGHDELSDSTEPSDSSVVVNSSSYNRHDSIDESVGDTTNTHTADSSSIDEKSELPCDPEPTHSAHLAADSLPEQCMRQYEYFFVTFMYSIRQRVGETRQVCIMKNCIVSCKSSYPNSGFG